MQIKCISVNVDIILDQDTLKIHLSNLKQIMDDITILATLALDRGDSEEYDMLVDMWIASAKHRREYERFAI